jgi:hypothetical protein
MDRILLVRYVHGEPPWNETYAPSARFQIPSKLEGQEYLDWLDENLARFVGKLAKHSANEAAAIRQDFIRKSGEESGIGGIYIDDTYFDHCKLFAYDGGPDSPFGWKGIVLRNHSDQRSKVEPLYALAGKLEHFLWQYEIDHKRFGQRIGEPNEVEQVTPRT